MNEKSKTDKTVNEATNPACFLGAVMPSLPTPLKDLFSFIDDGCVEIFFYVNDGFDRQEKVNGKELMKKYILDAWNEGNGA